MKLALIGYGKMGQLIERLALSKKHTIVAKLTSSSHDASLMDTDVLIDFSHPDNALNSIKMAAKLKKNLVMGTTGWYSHMDEVKSIIKDAGIGFIYAPNFSLGSALFHDMISYAAKLMAPFDNYDVNAFEIHHQNKVDSPSGTAKALMHQLNTLIPRKQGNINFASIRVGSDPGSHSIIFDSPSDTITLTHSARNREAFVEGALFATEWIAGKKGFYKFDDIIQENFHE